MVRRSFLMALKLVGVGSSRLRAGWITIGENDCHIEVNGNGDVAKGPPSLKGDAVGSLNDKSKSTVRNAKRSHAKAEEKTGRDYTTREAQALGSDKRVAQHQSAKEAARGSRVPTHVVLQNMRQAHQFLSDQVNQREAAKETARKVTGLNAGNLAKLENTYHDHSNVEGFDVNARTVAYNHPELGFDPDSTETPGKVWDLIREGKQEAPALHSQAVANQAAEWLQQSRPKHSVAFHQTTHGDGFDSFDSPPSVSSSHPSGKRAKEVIPFGRSPGRRRLLNSIKAGRLLAVKPSGSVMRIMGTVVRLRAHSGADRTYREFTGSAYNGGLMYPEITVNGISKTVAVVLDLDTLTIPQPERPVLDDHDETTDGVIGQTTMIAVRKSDYTIPVSGILYTRKERSKKILQASDGGHRWQLSVGTDNFTLDKIQAGQSVRVNNRKFDGPVSIVRNAYLTDLSFVAIGGDDTTHATIAARRAVSGVQARRPVLISG